MYTFTCGAVKPGGHTQKGNKSGQFNVIDIKKEMFEKYCNENGFISDYAWIKNNMK